MATSREFLELGDQWLITYAHIISDTPITTLFIIGHCLESYCKAALLKNDSKADVFKFGHDIESMIIEIKNVTTILKEVRFYPNVEPRFMTGGLIPFTDTLMSDEEYLHFISNQELYWVAKFQKEIKYFGTSGKKVPMQYSVTVIARNPHWVAILKEIRDYIKDDSTEGSFEMSRFINSIDSPKFAVDFIRMIV